MIAARVAYTDSLLFRLPTFLSFRFSMIFLFVLIFFHALICWVLQQSHFNVLLLIYIYILSERKLKWNQEKKSLNSKDSVKRHGMAWQSGRCCWHGCVNLCESIMQMEVTAHSLFMISHVNELSSACIYQCQFARRFHFECYTRICVHDDKSRLEYYNQARLCIWLCLSPLCSYDRCDITNLLWVQIA